MMNLPKIEFKEISLQDNIDIIKWTYFEESDTMSMREYTIQCFPELKDISRSLTQSEVNKIIEEVVTKNYNESLDFLKEEAKRYNELWKEYNDKYFSVLYPELELFKGWAEFEYHNFTLLIEIENEEFTKLISSISGSYKIGEQLITIEYHIQVSFYDYGTTVVAIPE